MLALALKNARSEADKNLEMARLAAAKTEAFQILVESLKAEKVVLENENLKTSSALEKEQAKTLENEKGRLLEQAAIAALREKLASESEELGILTLNLEAEKQKALKTLELLASARAVKKSLEEKNRLITEKGISVQAELEAKKLALREARAQLIQEKDLIKASASEVNRLNIVSTNLSKKLSELQSILDESESRDAKKSVQIQVLGGRLNAALARVASEQKKLAEIEAREVERLRLEANDLKNYKSEFFGRLKKILGGKPGIEVVGDRFVFSSEVLFKPGSAVLGNDGKVQLSEVAHVVRNVSKDIPTQINWVLRVDGHTDIMPLAKTSKYTDNWELSQARALSVVKYLIKVEGLSANRLAATGFGEFQPLTFDLAPESLARNRRIELKLTEK